MPKLAICSLTRDLQSTKKHSYIYHFVRISLGPWSIVLRENFRHNVGTALFQSAPRWHNVGTALSQSALRRHNVGTALSQSAPRQQNVGTALS